MWGIQRAYERAPSDFLSTLEKELQCEYGMMLKQEELFWFHKSRAKWFVEGENNTRCFHTMALVRKKKHMITMLMTSDGQ